jgi:hypothetical protein
VRNGVVVLETKKEEGREKVTKKKYKYENYEAFPSPYFKLNRSRNVTREVL